MAVPWVQGKARRDDCPTRLGRLHPAVWFFGRFLGRDSLVPFMGLRWQSHWSWRAPAGWDKGHTFLVSRKEYLKLLRLLSDPTITDWTESGLDSHLFRKKYILFTVHQWFWLPILIHNNCLYHGQPFTECYTGNSLERQPSKISILNDLYYPCMTNKSTAIKTNYLQL